MKLLVLAQTPPPLHGQSAMVRVMLEALGRPGNGFELHHVNLHLSRDSTDVGRWRPGKLFKLLATCVRVWYVRWQQGPMILYYVPAPAKRGALLRDWIAMALCRPFFSGLVLHWHAVGLGHWLETRATTFERRLSRRLLGNADLSIVLAREVAADAGMLWPRQIAIVPNALSETGLLQPRRERQPSGRFEILFIGLCSAEKGLFDVIEAVGQLHSRTPGAFRLTVAGAFDSRETQKKFFARADELEAAVRYVGFADGATKSALFAESDVLCFPTYYPHEGQPLVIIEAFAHDLPIITTRWRAIPSMLPKTHVWLVEPRRSDQLASAILLARKAGPTNGVLKEHYLLNFTPAQHVVALKDALHSLKPEA